MNSKINTTRFGEVAIGAEHIIDFRDGMIGFSKLKKYVLVESPSMPLVLWLQSVDDADIAFPVIEPYFFKRDYKVPMSDADRHILGFEDGDTAKIFVVLTIPEDMERMTVNLKAPIIVDIQKSTGTQTILQEKTYEVRTPAHESFSRAMSNFNPVQNASFEDDAEDSWSAVSVRSHVTVSGPGLSL